jgi:hypothetical protein
VADSLRVAARAFMFTRAAVWVCGMAAAHWAGLSVRAPAFDPLGLTRGFGSFGDVLLAPAARWDTVWYVTIADHGYSDTTHAAFFPLYPFASRALGVVFGSALVGGLVVSFAASIVALALLHRLVLVELRDERAATWCVWLLACFPAAFFLSAVYSEGLFLALSVGCVLAARRGRWWLAGGLGLLAAATRSAGVVLVVPLLLVWWDSRRRPGDLAAVVLVPAGLAVFAGALALAGLDGLAPFHAQEQWFRHWAGPFVGIKDGAVAAWDGARQLLHGSRTPVYFTKAGGDPYVNAYHNLELFGTLLALVPMVVGTLRRLPLAYGAYVVAALFLPLSWPVEPQPLMSLPRFALVLFPLFMWLGWWAARGRLRGWVVGAAFMGLQLWAVGEFATWHWVA